MISLFTYTFFNHALLTAILGSISCGLIGSYIVTRRLVFITGGITHASFGGLGIGYFLGISPLLGAAVFGGLSAFGVQYLSSKQKLRVDSAIAMAWSFGMAVGIIFIFLTPGYAPNLMSYLFGSILTVSVSDLIVMLVLAGISTFIFITFKRSIQLISFDEAFARSQGIKVDVFNYILILLIALTAVIYIRVAGIILVLSLLTVPQNLAIMITRNYNKILLFSILFGFVGTIAGLLLSYFLDIPSGAAIIFSLISEYFIGWCIIKLSSLTKVKPS
jgi:zinc transport system permease protein